jgi:hypothetical protein
MDKKTKLYLGLGVVAVGAYLLLKSKKAAATTTAPVAPAKFVGADSFASVGANQKFTNLAGGVMSDRMKSADGFASVGERMISADSTKFAGVGQRQVAATGGMINSLDVKGARAGSQNAGIFANQPFTGDVANMVGANGEQIFANQSGKGFFYPKTARYGQNQGVFAPSKPKMKLPVEPNLPVPVRQGAPLNNLVGADGGFFSVHDGFGK